MQQEAGRARLVAIVYIRYGNDIAKGLVAHVFWAGDVGKRGMRGMARARWMALAVVRVRTRGAIGPHRPVPFRAQTSMGGALPDARGQTVFQRGFRRFATSTSYFQYFFRGLS